MNLLGILENGLFALAQVLRLPVIVSLWVAVGAAAFWRAGVSWSISHAGGNARVSISTRGSMPDRRSARTPRGGRRCGSPPRLLRDVEAEREKPSFGAGGLEHLVLEREERVRGTLKWSRLLVRVGPSLGLLGTLIPMGAALASLTAGNLEAMAGQMVVAFTTTIVGLATGTIAYVIQVVRHGWVNETVREQRFLAERLAADLAHDLRDPASEEGHDGTLSAPGTAADAEDEDPLSGVANIFDVSVVFIVGLMITLFSVYRIGDLVDPESEVTLVKTNADG